MMPQKCKPIHDKEDEKASEVLTELAKTFPYRREFKNDCDHKLQTLLSIHRLEQSREKDPDHFWLDMSKPNYLTMLYVYSDIAKAEQLNEETLEKVPQSFNALWNKFEINRKCKKYKMVREIEEQLKTVLKDPTQMMIAKAEVGLSYADFGPRFYQKSIEILEDVLRHQIFTTRNAGTQSKWKFDLAHTYDRLMNKGTIASYWEEKACSPPSKEDIFRRIKELLLEVVESKDAFYAPKSWIELGDAYKKYEDGTRDEKRRESLPNNWTVDDCFEKALKTGPEDAFVLERCGRHYRQRATGIKDFEGAIDLFKKCVELDPLRDVAYHHMGLAYRSMWLEKEGHDEARLHTNKTKKFGDKRSMQKRQQNYNSDQRNHRSNYSQNKSYRQESPVEQPARKLENNEHYNQRKGSSKNSCSFQSTECKGSRVSGDGDGFHSGSSQIIYDRSNKDGVNSVPDGKAQNFGNFKSVGHGASESEAAVTDYHGHRAARAPRSGPTSSDFIPPKYQKQDNEPAKQFYRKPDYFDRLRVGNPPIKNPINRWLLEEAIRCIETASKLRQDQSSRYLIDLARLYVSKGDNDKARLLLSEADQTNFGSNDGAYLYEQWGLLDESLLDEANETIDMEGVKNLYRTAMAYSVEAMERSKVAFNKLKEILNRQKEEDPSSEILEKEHLLLYTTIQDARKAEEIIGRLKNDEKNIVLMWELVEMFYKRNRPEDVDAAFTYLTILAEGKKLKDVVASEELDKDEIRAWRSEMVISVSERKALKESRKSDDLLKKTYQWLVSIASDVDAVSESELKKLMKVCVLAASDEAPEVCTVVEMLEKVMGLEIFRAFIDSGDIECGTNTLEEIVRNTKEVETAIVVMQKTVKELDETEEGSGLDKEERIMIHALKSIFNNPDIIPRRRCRAVSTKSKKIECEGTNINRLKEWNLNESDNPVALAYSLLKLLFLVKADSDSSPD